MSFLLRLLREGLGRIIVFIDWVSRPKKLQRSPELQAHVELDAQLLSLYQFYACPFCIRTRRVIHQLNVPIEMRDIRKELAYRQELEQQGGKVTVPCLRIEKAGVVEWLYESKDIIHYLNQRFAPA